MSADLKQDIIQAARKGNCPEYKQNSHACWGCPCATFDDDTYICNSSKYDKAVYNAKPATAFGKLEFNPWTTLTIENCEKIILKPKGVEFEAELPTEHFDDIEEIIINGNKFVREK